MLSVFDSVEEEGEGKRPTVGVVSEVKDTVDDEAIRGCCCCC